MASRACRSEAYNQNGRCVCDSLVFFFSGVGARGRRPLRIRRPRRMLRGSRRAGRSRRGEKSRKVVLEVVTAAGAGGLGGYRPVSRGCRFCCPGQGFLASAPPGRGSELGVGQLLPISALCRPALWPRPQLDFERNELPPLVKSVGKSYCDGYRAAGPLKKMRDVVVL